MDIKLYNTFNAIYPFSILLPVIFPTLKLKLYIFQQSFRAKNQGEEGKKRKIKKQKERKQKINEQNTVEQRVKQKQIRIYYKETNLKSSDDASVLRSTYFLSNVT